MMAMDLDVRHLRLLIEIADCGGLTRAAESLHLTQSAASHQLKDAEEKLGTPLFRREGRVLVRTEAGERMLGAARRVLEELEIAERDARRIAGGERQKLRLSTECYTCYYWLGPLMERFARRFPDVDVDVVIEATSRPVDFLLRGKLDLAVVDEPTRDRGIEWEPVLKDELVAVLPPSHPAARKPFLEPKDYAGETVVLYEGKLEEFRFLREFLWPAKVEPKRIHQVRLTEAILELGRAGRGVSALARWSVEEQAHRLGLVTRPLGRKGLRRNWVAGRRAGPCPPHLREFIDLLATSPTLARLSVAG